MMTFAVRHGLSGVALIDLLTLIEIHCMVPNMCKTSMKLLRGFFRQLRSQIEFHYYCKLCHEYIGLQRPEDCPNKHCLQETSDSSYFLVIPFAVQLQHLFAREY